jgi:integrase
MAAIPRPAEVPSEPATGTFEEHARVYLAFSRLHHTASTHRTRRDLVQNKLVPYFRGWRLDDIRPRDVEDLLARHAALSPASRNRILSALSALLRHARRTGLVRRNVALGMPRAREEVLALPLVARDDQARLLAELPEPRRLLFLTALDSGARLGELLRLRWSDVDLERGALLVRRSKSGRPRIVRASRRLARALAEAARALGGAAVGERAVFAAAVGADGALRWSWRRSFKRAAASIGHPRLRIHDLRHLAAINLVRAGVDLPTVQAHLGHRHLVSTLRYAAYADETASARAARALDRLHEEAD